MLHKIIIAKTPQYTSNIQYVIGRYYMAGSHVISVLNVPKYEKYIPYIVSHWDEGKICDVFIKDTWYRVMHIRCAKFS